jgi:hypothetical protein
MLHARFTVDADVTPRFTACYLRVAGNECAFIEAHTAHALPRLLKSLADNGKRPEDVRYVVVTHAHLDHAAGAGALLAACPNATLLAHPREARRRSHRRLRRGPLRRALRSVDPHRRRAGPRATRRRHVRPRRRPLHGVAHGRARVSPLHRGRPRVRHGLHRRHVRPRVSRAPELRALRAPVNEPYRVPRRRSAKEPRQGALARPTLRLPDALRRLRGRSRDRGPGAAVRRPRRSVGRRGRSER